MKILVLGGTRFVGLALARSLVKTGHQVCVSSRNTKNAPLGADIFFGQRDDAVTRLGLSEIFDTIIDFTSYSGVSTEQVLSTFPRSRYILISTVWVTRAKYGVSVDNIIPNEFSLPESLPPVTRQYIEGKISAERVTQEAYANGRSAITIRLPIMCGINDHTGRLNYYRLRVMDGAEQIMVDGGGNFVNLAWDEDVAEAICRLIGTSEALPCVIESITPYAVTVYELNRMISSASHTKPRPVSIPEGILSIRFPQFLAYEPFWRERAVAMTENNLFNITGLKPTSLSVWLSRVIQSMSNVPLNDVRRAAELDFLQYLRNA